MWATRRLSADHQAFLKLLDQMEDLAAVPGLHARSRLREALAQFRETLVPHEEFEEEVLFPSLEAAKEDRPADAPAPGSVLALDHREIWRLFAAIVEGMNSDEGSIAGAVTRLREVFRRHAEAEDAALFPLAETVLGAAKLESMALEMDRRARLRRLSAAQFLKGPTRA